MKTRSKREAFTLIELVIVLSLIMVISALGVGSVYELLPRFRMVKVARGLQSDISALRNTAITSNREVRLLLVDADANWNTPDDASVGEWWMQVGNRQVGSGRWDTLPLDSQTDGTDDVASVGVVRITVGGEDAANGVSLKPWDAIVGPGSSNTDAIVFSPRGWVTNPPSDFGSDGYITLTLVNKMAFKHGYEDSITLRVAQSGMVLVDSTLGSSS